MSSRKGTTLLTCSSMVRTRYTESSKSRGMATSSLTDLAIRDILTGTTSSGIASSRKGWANMNRRKVVVRKLKDIKMEFHEGDVVCEIGHKRMWCVEEVHCDGYYYFTTLGYDEKMGRLLSCTEAEPNYVKVGNVNLGDW